MSEALRPAATTERWRQRLADKDFDAAAARALEKLSLIEAANAEEEALAIAVAMREALETPGKTVALVTPDRALARRVKAALDRWQVAVDDSGGDALADTSAGLFARLAAETALGGLEPVPLLALLKHPLLRLGQRQATRMIMRCPRSNARCCAARARRPAARASRMRSQPSAPRATICIRAIRASMIRDDELDAAGGAHRHARRRAGAAGSA